MVLFKDSSISKLDLMFNSFSTFEVSGTSKEVLLYWSFEDLILISMSLLIIFLILLASSTKVVESALHRLYTSPTLP